MSGQEEMIKDLQRKVEKRCIDIKDKYMANFQSSESLIVTAVSLELLHNAIILQFDSDEKTVYDVIVNSISAEAKVVRKKPSKPKSEVQKE